VTPVPFIPDGAVENRISLLATAYVLRADWIHTVPDPDNPLALQFTDRSRYTVGSGTIDSWAWTFGDGGTSTLQNPTHTFSPGTYNVRLTVRGNNGFSGGLKILTLS